MIYHIYNNIVFELGLVDVILVYGAVKSSRGPGINMPVCDRKMRFFSSDIYEIMNGNPSGLLRY